MADKKEEKGKGKGDKPKDAKPAAAKPQAAAAGKGGKDGGKGGKGRGEAKAAPTAEVADVPRDPNYTPRLRNKYREVSAPALRKRFGYKNPMMVPRLEKVVINMGLGAAVGNPKIIDSAVEDMRAISGQKPVVTRARKSIATFKLRENLPIGVMVTLRGERMWEFVDRLISFSLPRVRDFKGVSPKGFDGKGNFTMGLREQIIFPEVDYDKVDVVKGMNISFVTTARTDEEGRALLTELGIPFRH
jgi:large subunit ribosomal protein L5